MNIDTQDLSSYIAGYDDYVDDTRPVYSTKEYYDMKELLESEIEDKEEEIERLNNIINKLEQWLVERIDEYKEMELYDNASAYDYTLYTLQELKGSDKE